MSSSPGFSSHPTQHALRLVPSEQTLTPFIPMPALPVQATWTAESLQQPSATSFSDRPFSQEVRSHAKCVNLSHPLKLSISLRPQAVAHTALYVPAPASLFERVSSHSNVKLSSASVPLHVLFPLPPQPFHGLLLHFPAFSEESSLTLLKMSYCFSLQSLPRTRLYFSSLQVSPFEITLQTNLFTYLVQHLSFPMPGSSVRAEPCHPGSCVSAAAEQDLADSRAQYLLSAWIKE